jgi:hypothetical protein
MLYACVARFSVKGNLKSFAKFFGTKQGHNGTKNHAKFLVKR